MSKTSYQNITELVSDLSSKVNDLDSGNMSLNELEELVQKANDLYDRLVVIRHKAYEQLASEEAAEEVAQMENEFVESEPVVEEAVVEEKEEEQPAFDFAFDMEAEEEEETVGDQSSEETSTDEEEIPDSEVENEAEGEEDIQEEEEQNPVEDSPEEEAEPLAQDESVEPLKASLSLNDLLGDSEESLRKRLQNSPVEDIPSQISLQKKYEYITDMFNGSDDEYEQAIQALNSCSGAEEAREKLATYSSDFKWDLENKSIIKFIELVERRYM